MADNFSENVEASAGEFPPEFYAQTTHHFLQILSDELSGYFLPITSVQRATKPFIVGFIPPQQTVTGRLLDRAASLRGQKEDPASPETGDERKTSPETPASEYNFVPGSEPNLNDKSDPRVNPQLLPPSFWDEYVRVCNRLGVKPEDLARVIMTESGFKSGNTNYVLKDGKPTNIKQAKGFNQLTKGGLGATKPPVTVQEWEEMDRLSPYENLGYMERYFRGAGVRGNSALSIYAKNFGGYNNPNGTRYAGYASQDAYLASKGVPPPYDDAKRAQYFRNPSGQQNAIVQNPGLAGGKGYILTSDLERIMSSVPLWMAQAIQSAKARVGNEKGTPPNGPTASQGWVKNGSKQAQQADQELNDFAGKDLNKSKLGQRYMEAQRQTVLALADSVQTMSTTPPLRLLVNPYSFKVSSEAKVNNSDRSRTGVIVQIAPSDQEKIEASGSIAAFFVSDLRGTDGGLTHTAAQFSYSYANFLSLYLIYRNNGAIYLDDSLSLLGSVFIYYDGIFYVGKFDNFSVTRAVEKPFSLEYSFSFSVSYTFLLDRPEDPNHTYGRAKKPEPDVEGDFLKRAEEDRIREEQAEAARLEEFQKQMERDYLEAQAERAEQQRRKEWDKAAQKFDNEMGVFPSPNMSGPEQSVIDLLSKQKPSTGKTVIKKKK